MSEIHGHSKIMFSCGVHVDSQCRCIGHNKEVVIGKRKCPDYGCLAAFANKGENEAPPSGQIRRFEIEWPIDLAPLWMNTSNLLICLTEYCRGVRFRARDVTGDGVATTEWQEARLEPDNRPGGPTTFERELRALINRRSQEAASDTPDFVLAEFLSQSLDAFNVAVVAREKWYGRR